MPKKSLRCQVQGPPIATCDDGVRPGHTPHQHSWKPEEGGAFAADSALGLDGLLTLQARRVVTLVGVEQSFAQAQHLIGELCGWQIDDDVIRRTTHAQAKRAQAARATRSGAKTFAEEGPIEVHSTRARSVPSRGGGT